MSEVIQSAIKRWEAGEWLVLVTRIVDKEIRRQGRETRVEPINDYFTAYRGPAEWRADLVMQAWLKKRPDPVEQEPGPVEVSTHEDPQVSTADPQGI